MEQETLIPNWDVFKYKFSPNCEYYFEQFCHQLVCSEFGLPYGNHGYINHSAVETDPIKIKDEQIVWQAKFLTSSLAKKANVIEKSIIAAKKKYPDTTKYLFFSNLGWSENRGNPPKAKIKIEALAENLDLRIEWRNEKYFQSPFVLIDRQNISVRYFSKRDFRTLEERLTEYLLDYSQWIYDGIDEAYYQIEPDFRLKIISQEKSEGKFWWETKGMVEIPDRITYLFTFKRNKIKEFPIIYFRNEQLKFPHPDVEFFAYPFGKEKLSSKFYLDIFYYVKGSIDYNLLLHIRHREKQEAMILNMNHKLSSQIKPSIIELPFLIFNSIDEKNIFTQNLYKERENGIFLSDEELDIMKFPGREFSKRIFESYSD